MMAKVRHNDDDNYKNKAFLSKW